ncbi:MAG: tetratricopeptide repeat protein [Gaiellaceae bacterium]
MSDVEERRLDLARHYSAIGQPARALETLDGLEALDDPEVWSLRGESLYQLDRYREGAEAARRGLALDPEDLGLLDVLALNLMELGDLAGAETALLSALELWPENEILLCHYALACAQHGQKEKAERLVERAARLDPESVDVLRARAQVAYLIGDKRATSRRVDELLAVEPEDRVGHMLRGNLHVEGSNVYEAVRHHEQAVRLDPSDRELADVVRHNRTLTHWLQWPIYPVQRFGMFKVWGAYLALFVVVSLIGNPYLIAGLVGLYLFMVVYSWTVAPLARWWMQRRIR